jgi:hypothetical protein
MSAVKVHQHETFYNTDFFMNICSYGDSAWTHYAQKEGFLQAL